MSHDLSRPPPIRPPPQQCGSSTRFWLRGGEGSWYFMCEETARVPACSAPLSASFCRNKAAGKYPVGEGSAECTQFWECDGSSDAASPMTCPTDQAFDGTNCVAIETVLTCPAITRACVGELSETKIAVTSPTACTADYLQCDGTSPIATEATCATGTIFDSVSRACVAPASITGCGVVSAAGYCTGKGLAGAFPNPNEASNPCSPTYWTCNWTGATNANERTCAVGSVLHYNAAAPTWNFFCGPAPAGC